MISSRLSRRLVAYSRLSQHSDTLCKCCLSPERLVSAFPSPVPPFNRISHSDTVSVLTVLHGAVGTSLDPQSERDWHSEKSTGTAAQLLPPKLLQPPRHTRRQKREEEGGWRFWRKHVLQRLCECPQHVTVNTETEKSPPLDLTDSQQWQRHRVAQREGGTTHLLKAAQSYFPRQTSPPRHTTTTLTKPVPWAANENE